MNGKPILGNKTKVAIFIQHQKTKAKQEMIIPNKYNCALTSKEGKELFKARQYSPDLKIRGVRK